MAGTLAILPIIGLIIYANASAGSSSSDGGSSMISVIGTNTADSVPVPSSARAKLGINVASVTYWSGEQTFANQAMPATWLDPNAGWQGISKTRIGKNGMPSAVEEGHTVNSILNPPAASFTTTMARTRCKWGGAGKVAVGGNYGGLSTGDHWLEFVWPRALPAVQRIWIEIRESRAGDPIRDLDCRMKVNSPDAVFAPELLKFLKPFGVLRFLDWGTANSNPTDVTWAARSLPGDIGFRGKDGVPAEYVIALANENDSSPWVPVPWNATEDYHRGLAKALHDGIPAHRQVYVELSNEVWNYGFGQTHQVEAEGVAAKLSDTRFQSALHRYAQKTSWAMKIWAEVFADRPGQLVRVAATQNDNPWTADVVLAYGDLKDNVDALATAPYFGHGFFDANPAELDPNKLITTLAGYAKAVVAGPVSKNAAIARRYGKRFITYEGGQHLVPGPNQARTSIVRTMMRDPAMETIYYDYLSGMKSSTGDLVTLYLATGGIGEFGAWGIREYAGQPTAETPKLRAVERFSGGR